MIVKLTGNIWFGDWKSPSEIPRKVKTIICVAHKFNIHGADVYWPEIMRNLSWKIDYHRLALRDKDAVDEAYLQRLARIVNHSRLSILCHCQMGGHRGPASAMIAAWILNDGKDIDRINERLIELSPGLIKARENGYYNSAVQLLKQIEISGLTHVFTR